MARALQVGLVFTLIGCSDPEPVQAPVDGPACAFDLPRVGPGVDPAATVSLAVSAGGYDDEVVLEWTSRCEDGAWVETHGSIALLGAPFELGHRDGGQWGDYWAVSAGNPDEVYSDNRWNGFAVELLLRADSGGAPVVELTIWAEEQPVILVAPAPAGLLEPLDRN
ncbi:MAG: hypothetical protein R3F61_13840 [Myxococcota bacterium]